MNPDVLIIGGGSAGVAAALAAARQGANTLLVERHGFFGGAGTASLVHSFCGLYDLPPTPDTAPKVANPGIPAELERALLAQGIAHGPLRMGKVDVLMHQPQQLALFYDQWCAKQSNLKMLLHTEVIHAAVEGNRISEVTLHCRGTSWKLRPRTIVDASGDAVLATLANHPWDKTPAQELQRPAYIVGLGEVDAAALTGDGPLKIAGCLAKAIQEKKLPSEAAGAHFRASGALNEVFLTLDLPGDSPECPFDATDPRSLTWIEMQGREVTFAIVDHLRSSLEGFAKARVTTLPVRAGIRESRRWIAEAVLTEEDILASRSGDQAVANATWPLELRETARGPRLLYPHEPKACGIPLGALRARDLQNVFVAGRCLSATHRAQASIRVMGTALATGQAAGIAAASDEQDTATLAQQVRAVLRKLEPAQ
ncbi:FAD-dependent oxidoreductase [Prosthecobacter sp.]|uniref:FAD-dependent oxidoreductase n=1 Tax=Prosthecobacter sp. TaxID=1965333 RepID=UPI002AB9B0CE|nr:FAD-dependent oxidoreductase [Prosthecobacter sp.]MDZ4403764.1 FAD-dependent oxidoreductase [Prosthecobacter sp.]